jgi:hypothetical protein
LVVGREHNSDLFRATAAKARECEALRAVAEDLVAKLGKQNDHVRALEAELSEARKVGAK